MEQKLAILSLILAIVFVVGSQSVFTVDQREQAIVLQLGQLHMGAETVLNRLQVRDGWRRRGRSPAQEGDR